MRHSSWPPLVAVAFRSMEGFVRPHNIRQYTRQATVCHRKLTIFVLGRTATCIASILELLLLVHILTLQTREIYTINLINLNKYASTTVALNLKVSIFREKLRSYNLFL